MEKEIIEFIKEYYQGELIENSKSIINPYELDIYIPEKNLAVEFNGMLWHSYGNKIYNDSEENLNFQKFRHLKKTEAAEKKGINLLHIFENEWSNPKIREIWKSVILYKLGIIKKIKEIKEFLEKLLPEKRRELFVILITSNVKTFDPVETFVYSVNLLIDFSDLNYFPQLYHKSKLYWEQLYRDYKKNAF